MSRAYNQVFWGLIFIFFKITFIQSSDFQVTSSFVGYILIILGFNELSKKQREFLVAKKYAITSFVINVGTMFLYNDSIDYLKNADIIAINQETIIVSLILVLENLINIAMVYYICMGIYTSAKNINKKFLMNKANNRFYMFMWAHIIQIICGAFAINAYESMRVIVIGVSAVTLIITIMVIALVREARREICYICAENGKLLNGQNIEKS